MRLGWVWRSCRRYRYCRCRCRCCRWASWEGDEGGRSWEYEKLTAKSSVWERIGWNWTKLEQNDTIHHGEINFLPSLRWFWSSSTRARPSWTAARRDSLDPATTDVLTINMAARMTMRDWKDFMVLCVGFRLCSSLIDWEYCCKCCCRRCCCFSDSWLLMLPPRLLFKNDVEAASRRSVGW